MRDLGGQAFSRLLARLNVDPVLAGAEYERLRARLICFFERKGCRVPAELSDETINRIASKIEEGDQIADVFKFSIGVARLVLLEYWADPIREWEQLNENLSSSEKEEGFDEQRLHCMTSCLQSLSAEERDLIIKNCTMDKQGKGELAKSMGLTINALRLRVFRIRRKLYECRERCIRKS